MGRLVVCEGVRAGGLRGVGQPAIQKEECMLTEDSNVR